MLRIRCGLTQGQVAEKLLLSVQAVSKWETGKNLPDIMLLPEIADLYGVTIDELFRELKTAKTTAGQTEKEPSS